MFLRFIICLTLSFSLEITGKVLDIDSKEPVVGANIEIGEQGTATDKMGVFFIELNSDQINKLKISHISYVDLEYSFSDNKNILIIAHLLLYFSGGSNRPILPKSCLRMVNSLPAVGVTSSTISIFRASSNPYIFTF